MVRLHQLEIFAQSFPILLLFFTVLYSLLSIGTLGLLGWLVVSFVQDLHAECDVPLRLWAIVDFSSTAYHAVHGALLQYFCSSAAHGEQPLPWYERLHLLIVTAFDFTWLSLGLHWLRSSETCASTAPRLFASAEVYAISSIVGSFFICVNMVGIYTIMNYMMQNGVLRTKDGAPPGTLAKLKVVKFDPQLELFKENTECCVCLAPFTASMEVRLTECGHAFHSRCVGNWLKVSRTCPLCRQDLSPPGDADEAPERGAGGSAPPGGAAPLPREATAQVVGWSEVDT